jgi:anti-sigma factor RsiW
VKHPRRELGLYADGALPRAEAPALAAHVVACARCRSLLAELERGVGAARLLDKVPLPAHRAAAIERSLADAPIGREHPRRPPKRAAALAAVLTVGALGGGALYVSQAARRPSFRAVRGEPIAFEELALAAHEDLRHGARLDVESASADELRGFLRAHGLSVGLAHQRAGAPPAVELAGVRLVPGGREPVALVSYHVDGHLASLVVTKGPDVPEAPSWSPFGKRIWVRNAGGVTLLTWRNSGNAYTLVSELPGLGEKACFVCHTDPERRRVITEAARAAPPRPAGAANDS